VVDAVFAAVGLADALAQRVELVGRRAEHAHAAGHAASCVVAVGDGRVAGEAAVGVVAVGLGVVAADAREAIAGGAGAVGAVLPPPEVLAGDESCNLRLHRSVLQPEKIHQSLGYHTPSRLRWTAWMLN
jgi:hypothetical protein